MPAELTLETLAASIKDINVLVGSIKKGMDDNEHDKEHEKEAKKAQDEKEEKEKMEAKKAKYSAALKLAMDEDDHDKKEAMIKQAQEDLHKEDHEANHDNHDKNMDKHEATEEEKEKDAQIASIINEKKKEIITKILTANSIMNPNALKEVEERLKKASITDVEKEWNILKPAFEGSVAQPTQNTQKFIGYYANVSPADIDASTLTAASPDSEFTKLSTKELLEGTD